MRSHRALNRDIAEHGLDPRQPFTKDALGGDGRLAPLDEEQVQEQLQAVVEAVEKLFEPETAAEVVAAVIDTATTGAETVTVSTTDVVPTAVINTASTAETITVPSFEAPEPVETEAAVEPEKPAAETTPKKKRGKEKVNSPA